MASPVNAGCALVHRWLALVERESPSRTASAELFVPGATADVPPGSFAALYRGSEPAASGNLRLEFELAGGRIVAEHRDGQDGGRLAGVAFASDDAARFAPGGDAFARNRALAFAYRWLWAWERAPDERFFGELLDLGCLDATFGDGRRTRSAGEFFEVARSLADAARGAQHVLRAVTIEAHEERRYAVDATIDWRGHSGGGTPLRARTRQRWTLRETGERYPLLQRLSIDVVHPLEPDLGERFEDPDLANAPSDDAESGGA